MVSLLNVYAPFKKISRSKSCKLCGKVTSKAIMQRPRLRNIFLKQRPETTKVAYNQQRSKCISILKKSKRSYFESLDVKFVKNNREFSKKILPLFSNKIKSKEKIALVENYEIISIAMEVAETFRNFFSSIIKNLNIQRDEKHLFKTAQDIPVISKNVWRQPVKNYLLNVKTKKFLTEIENLNFRKAQENYISVKKLKRNSDVYSYIITLITFCLVINFQNILKRQM